MDFFCSWLSVYNNNDNIYKAQSCKGEERSARGGGGEREREREREGERGREREGEREREKEREREEGGKKAQRATKIQIIIKQLL